MRDTVVKQFSAAGFQLHEITDVSSSATVLGTDVGGQPAKAQRAGAKLATLRRALWLAEGLVVSGRQIEVFVGHFVAACMLCRPALSCLRALCDFIKDRHDKPCRLWPSCRYECWVMGGVSILMSADLSRPWADRVVATDASTTGI